MAESGSIEQVAPFKTCRNIFQSIRSRDISKGIVSFASCCASMAGRYAGASPSGCMDQHCPRPAEGLLLYKYLVIELQDNR